MNVVTRKRLRAFWEKHPDSKEPLNAWHKVARSATWKNAAEVVTALPGVSVLNDNRFVFNIKGNDYRLVVKISFRFKTVFVRFVGTHPEYDNIDANTV